MKAELQTSEISTEFISEGLHPQNKKHKERLLSSPRWLCVERAQYYTYAYRETEGQPPSIRAAKALKKTSENMTIKIYPEEILVGNRGSNFIAPPFAPERGEFNFIFKTLLPTLLDQGYHISPEQKEVLFNEILPYWEGKTVREIKTEIFKKHKLNSTIKVSFNHINEILKAFGLSTIGNLLIEKNPNFSRTERLRRTGKMLTRLPILLKGVGVGTADNVKGRARCTDTQAHIVVGYKNVLEYGFKGIKERARKRLVSAKSNKEKAFPQAVEICCDAMKIFSERFADLALKASKEKEVDRKKELLKIAEVCRNVPWNPPQSFYEAIQSMWFVQNAIIVSYGMGSGITPGRVDQLLYPYYKKDIDEGNITKEQALRLLEEFIIKINNNVVIWPSLVSLRLNHLGSDVENITIGGVRRDGEDGTNELSYLFIEAIKNTKLATCASYRISNKTPEEFLRKVVELHKYTNGAAFFNDEILVRALMRDGYSLEDARDYCLVGCVEPCGNGDTFGATGGSKIYFPSVLDLVFNRGKCTFFGNQDSIDTGDPIKFKTFEEFMDAYYTHLEKVVDYCAKATNLRDGIWAQKYHNPLLSCTIDGCIENAMDMTEGGAIYNFAAIGGGGLGTITDSLAAIKKFVYDEKSVKMADLLLAIRTNFKNNEFLRQKLMNGPKYGVDDDYADSIASELFDKFCEMVNAQKRPRGGHYKPSFSSYGLNIYEGAMEPATPNGRKAGEPISNGISPCNRCEMKGPTAASNSVAKLDHTKVGFGSAFNMKFPATIYNSEQGADTLESLVKGYFDQGGMHIQFNVIDASVLKDAQLKPENYEDLIVRVTGYSAYYTRLGKVIQDDIIDRIEFTCSI